MQALAGLALPMMAAAGLVSSHSHSYTVRPGDTLSGIAQQVYGNPARWRQLFAANRRTISDASLIYPGQVLKVPQYRPQHAKPDPAPVMTVREAVARPAAQPAAGTVPGGTLGCSGLEALWEDAGGSHAAAFMAAEIAMAESGGRQYALSPTDDYGYWQINGSHGPAMATFDAYGNARAAIAISGDGTDWEPWTTFVTSAYQGRC
jgi:LysM repeat protein